MDLNTQITVKTDASDYTLATVLFHHESNGELHQLHSTPGPFCPRTHYMSMTKKLLAIFEAFKQWQHYLEGSGLPIEWSLITRICQYFSWPKSSHIDKAHWSKYLSRFNLLSVSSQKTWNQNLTHSLDDLMSILKRGIVTMPYQSTDYCPVFHFQATGIPSLKLPPYQSQPSVDLSSWMLKGSIWHLVSSERIPFPKNTSTISQTPCHDPFPC